MMNWKRLIGWPWFVKAEKREAMETGWETDDGWTWHRPFRGYTGTPEMTVSTATRLAALAMRRDELKDALAKAKAQKKARKHIYAALEANTRERLRIEGGE